MLAGLPVTRFLVTSGFRRLQESKIAALGIRGLPRRSKMDRFRDILARRGWQAPEVPVVGDNAGSEIPAGNALGMPTVQILRPGVVAAASAGRQVKDLRDLQEYAHSKKSSP